MKFSIFGPPNRLIISLGMKKSTGYLLLVCFYLVVCISYAQPQAPELFSDINVIPPSPTAASITKFVDYPVSYYTGAPQVSTPIYTIKTQQLEVPVSLSYHVTGLKVEEIASWVGAGWTLNAGGVITRSVKGLPDEYLNDPRKGYYHNRNVILANGSINGGALNDCSVTNAITSESPVNTPDSVSWGLLDTEPDVYALSAPGIDDKFFIGKTGEIVHYASSDLKYELYPFSNPSAIPTHTGPDYVWEVRGTDGKLYKFSSRERTITSSTCNGSRSMYDSPVDYQSSWYLDEISIGDEWIRFEYAAETLTYPVTISESSKLKVHGNDANTINSTCYNDNTVQSKRLSRIYSSNGYEILFEVDPVATRNDLNGSKKLNKAVVKFNNVFVTAFVFDHSYFGTNTKLKLNKVVQVDAYNNPVNQGQQFEYFSFGAFPAINSKSQDYWGYYNGHNQTSLIPEYKDDLYHLNRTSQTIRTPALNYGKVGTLSKINHATGGYTEFEYESHSYFDENRKQTYLFQASSQNQNLIWTDFTVGTQCSATIEEDILQDGPLSYSRLKKWNGSSYVIYVPAGVGGFGNRAILPPGQYRLEAYSESTETKFVKATFEQIVPGHVEVGGLRIKTIKHVDPLTSKSLIRTFDYSDPQTGNSSGKLFRAPLFGGYLTTSSKNEASTGCVPSAPTTYLNISSYSQVPMVVYSGSHIGYSVIRETRQDITGQVTNGYTVYRFINEKDNAIRSFPFTPDADFGYKNGKPTLTEVYKILPNGTPEIQTEKHYTYTEITQTGNTITGVNFKENASSYCYVCNSSKFSAGYYSVVTKWHRLATERTVTHEGNVQTEQTDTYFYDSQNAHLLYVKKEKEINPGEVYSEEIVRDTNYPGLIKKIETFYNSTKLSGAQTDYLFTQPLYLEEWDRGTNSYHRIKDFTYSSWKLVKEQGYRVGKGGPLIRSYLWEGDLLLAEIQNTETTEVFFDSFEDDVTNVSTTAITGNKSHDGQLTVTLPGAGTFRVTYWKKVGSGPWDYVETTMSSSGSIGATGTLIDELRIMPVSSFMKTFYYWPNGQLRSIVDENGQVTRFDFDPFGRLHYLSDTGKNIISRYSYYYKNQ